MDIRAFNRLLEPLWHRVMLMVAKGVIHLIQEEEGLRTLQLGLLADEEADAVEQVQEFGFTSQAPAGSEAVVVFAGGNRAHGIVVGTDDPRYRPLGLQPGEVAIYSAGDALGKDESLPEAPEMPPGLEGTPEGWPQGSEDPGAPGPPLCRIQLTPDRAIKITCADQSVTATGGIQLFGASDVSLASATKITLAAPMVKVHSPLGGELNLNELAGGESVQPVAHIGDPVRVVINDVVHCGEIVQECPGV